MVIFNGFPTVMIKEDVLYHALTSYPLLSMLGVGLQVTFIIVIQSIPQGFKGEGVGSGGVGLSKMYATYLLRTVHYV